MIKEDKILISKIKLKDYFADEDNVQYHEGCTLLGYMQNGDSFVFTQGMGFDKANDRRVMLCVSRRYLEKVLKNYPKATSSKL